LTQALPGRIVWFVMTRTEWKLSELADEAGVSSRTVRYYVQRGLLPAPIFRGPDTAYGPEHLLRLKAIKRLQEKFLPLEQIQVELGRLSIGELHRLVDNGEVPGFGSTGAMPPRQIFPRPSDPLPPPTFTPYARERGYQRWELAPGLELHISDDADERTRRLAERLRAQAAQERRSY
jgi:DNA-binding transcriptional MerR regulator